MRKIDKELFEAVNSNDCLMVKELLVKGANANAQDTRMITPFIMLCKMKRIEKFHLP